MSQATDPARDAKLLAQLDEATSRLLFPERFTEPLRITLVYAPLPDDAAAEAAQLAADAEHTVDPDGDHRVTYTLADLEPLHTMYALLERHGVELRILLDGKKVPMVRELWLPLLWTLRARSNDAD